MTDVTRKIEAKGRVDAKRSWWVSELMAACCTKTWLHPKWEDTMQRWYNWLCEMQKKDEEKRKEKEHQKLVSRMISSAEAQNYETNCLERRNTNPGRRRGRCQTFSHM